jgi:RimJ/RimL family protein N-acetyltransferase
MDLSELARLEGPNLVLRLIRPDDAQYVHGLRSDPAYNRHLSEIRGTAEDQRRWIEDYKAREAEGLEFYYVIERRDGVRCGLVRLYDIREDSFTWGSWILDANKPPKAALESALLLYDLGFDRLGQQKAVFDVRQENGHTLAFHRRFGATQTGEDDQNAYFVYPKVRYEVDRPGYLAILGEQART